MLATIPVAGTLYNTFTTAKSLLVSATATEASSGYIILPSGFFQRGAVIEIDFVIGLSNIVTSPGTFALQVMVGSTIAFTTGNINMTTTANTLAPVMGTIMLTANKVGVGLAQLAGQCELTGINVANTSGVANYGAGTGSVIAPQTAPALGTAFDSTIAQSLDFFGAFSTSNAGNGMQLNQYRAVSWGNTAV